MASIQRIVARTASERIAFITAAIEGVVTAIDHNRSGNEITIGQHRSVDKANGFHFLTCSCQGVDEGKLIIGAVDLDYQIIAVVALDNRDVAGGNSSAEFNRVVRVVP